MTPLDDELLLRSMHGREALGQPFVYELELLSPNRDIKAQALLGQYITILLDIAYPHERRFNGVVTRFAYAGQRGRLFCYQVTLRPWLWLLSNVVLNQVHQRVSIPELVLQLLRMYGFTDIAPMQLSGHYKPREFVVQYQESVFNFISRWLEHEGIYYYFKHREGGHTLHLVDAPSPSTDKVPGYETVSYRPFTESGHQVKEHFDSWQESSHVVAGTYSLDAFDFKKPTADLVARNPVPTEPRSEWEIFEALGDYDDPEVGQNYARLRAEELRAGQASFEGGGNVAGLRPGTLFTLSEFPRTSLNREYYVIGADYTIQAGEFESGTGMEFDVRSELRAVESSTPFRPARSTPRPMLAGPQTAIVVGVEGSEISSDEFGRIRVQFHWDHEHSRNEDSSCFVRVAQPWAGSGYGFQFIPRVGQEVVVAFLDGDPDQPIIMGSVYNRNQMPPYAPNRLATQSGIRTRSSKGGSSEQYNELRFEDKLDEEEVYLQAQRNLKELVKNDHATDVKGNQTNHVTKDQTENIDGNQTLSVQGDRKVSIHGSQSVSIDGASAVDGVSGSKLKVSGDYDVDVSKTVHVQAPVSIKLECGGSSILIEPTKISIMAGGQAVLVLDTAAMLKSAAEATLTLDTGLTGQSSQGAQLKLDVDAHLEGMQATCTGHVLAQTISGANSIKADPSGVSVTGAPMVRIN